MSRSRSAGRSVLHLELGLLLALVLLSTISSIGLAQADASIESRLVLAGTNRGEIERALDLVPKSQRMGMEFLVRNMPEVDLRSLSSVFLLEEVGVSYRAWLESPWRSRVSESVFLNDVLPYAVVSEERTASRRHLRARALPLVRGAATPTEAAVRLNQTIFREFGVRYSTERSRTDQNAMQVIEEQKATCTGLSTLLISACRSVGVPARLVGIPLWADSTGNHSWVEIWDDGWHFTGAAEPTDDRLDDGWFVEKASQAVPGVPIHSIYATSWEWTGLSFPLAWDEDGSLGYVQAVDVTSRYAGVAATPAGMARVEFVVRDEAGARVPTELVVVREGGGASGDGAAGSGVEGGTIVFRGATKGDGADGNDHVAVLLPLDGTYRVEWGSAKRAFVPVDGMLVRLPAGKLEGASLGWTGRVGATARDGAFRWGRR
ncbi:MAG: transglutaminase-like domain-containing protein [Candidatus Eisenbacteria bacterium]